MRRALALLALIGLGLVGCGRAENSLLLLDALPDVGSIEIEGNERFDDGTLKGLMTLRGPSRLNPFRDHKFRRGQLDSDIRAILTYYVGLLRDQEQQSDNTPTLLEYKWLFWVHAVVTCLLVVATVSFLYHAWHWMTTPVLLPA